uniref:Uncharacterized protein n=1 Tax=Arundo donax TaxID=35708 RepID=A0A0A9C3X3_ARUDO
MHQNIPDNMFAGSQQGSRILPDRTQIELQAGDVVPWLPNIHPKPGKNHGIQLFISNDSREYLLLE